MGDGLQALKHFAITSHPDQLSLAIPPWVVAMSTGDNTATARKTRNSAIADKPRDAFRGQSRTTNMVSFDMLVWFPTTVILFLKRAVFQIFDFKNVETLISESEITQGH